MFYFQLRLMRASMSDAKEAADAAKEAAESGAIQASALVDTVAVQKLAMVASDRAYVHYQGMKWISFTGPDGKVFWRLRPVLSNSGNTPTKTLNVFAKIELRDNPLPTNFEFAPAEPMGSNPAMLAPGGTLWSGNHAITAEDLIAVRDKKKFLYVWGIAIYHDVFPETPQRVTRFCVYLDEVSGKPTQSWNEKTNPVELLFPHYEKHNCVDGACSDYALPRLS